MTSEEVLAEIEAAVLEGRSAQLAGANLKSAYLAGENLEGANLPRANLEGANLEGANLEGASLKGAKLKGANLHRANLAAANLGGANLKDANLDGTDLYRANLSEASLENANLYQAHLYFANLSLANLTGASLEDADLKEAFLIDAFLGLAKLEGADLSRAHLKGANLKGANLADADLTDANLYRANLQGAKLGGANLYGANLEFANLEGANLTSADLTSANLEGANLTNANLKDAALTDANLDGVQGGESAVWTAEPLVPKKFREHYQLSTPDTENFRRWFGNSKAVAADGSPAVVYHGTELGGFSQFDPAKIDPHHPGFYFSDELQVASSYSRRPRWPFKDPTPELGSPDKTGISGAYRLFLSLQNPAVVDCKGSNWNEIDHPDFPGLRKTYEIAAEAKRRGYDGVIFRNIWDHGGKSGELKLGAVYVAFYPTQIKSALFNTGEFSPTDPDIRRNPRRRKTSRRARRTSRR